MKKGIIQTTKAFLISKGIEVYIYDGAKPNMNYNKGKAVVAKQPDTHYTFCADWNDLKILED